MKLRTKIIVAIFLLGGLFFTVRYFSTEVKLKRLSNKYEKVLEEYTTLAGEFDAFASEKQLELEGLISISERLEREYYFNKGNLSRLKKENLENREKAQELEQLLEHIRSAKELNIKIKLTNEELDLYFINLFDTLQ